MTYGEWEVTPHLLQWFLGYPTWRRKVVFTDRWKWEYHISCLSSCHTQTLRATSYRGETMPIWTARGYISFAQASRNVRNNLGLGPSAADVAQREAEWTRLLLLGQQDKKDKRIAELEARVSELEHKP